MKNLLILLIVFVTCSCSHYKDIPYFQNASEYNGTGKGFLYDMTIKPKDILHIFVFSSSGDEIAGLFNNRERVGLSSGDRTISDQGRGGFYKYLVDNQGEIEFPEIGKVKLEGMTLEQASEEMKKRLAPYFNDNSDFMVNVRMENFYVTVTGEVQKPNSFSVSRNKMTILEALAQAGDMTIYGKRDNVKILRELPDGTYEVHELDLRDANILDSPYYYLQQRDIVYVEPNEAMVQNAKVGTTTRLWVRGISITISLGSLLYRVLE